MRIFFNVKHWADSEINFQAWQGGMSPGSALSTQDSVLRLNKKADFTNEMGKEVGLRSGRKPWASVPMLPKTAIHGGFPLKDEPFHK